MENTETVPSETKKIGWRVGLSSFLIWFLLPLGTDELVAAISRRDYARLTGTLVVASLATYFIPIPLMRANRAE
jgi:hypothetical protein